MIDMYGRNVVKTTVDGKDIYTVEGGLIMEFPEGWPESRSLDTINAMAPDGW